MSLPAPVVYGVPEAPARVAKAAFPRQRGPAEAGYLRAAGGPSDLRPLCSTHGRPAAAPARLALVTVMQFAEGLSDRQAADAVRRRIDWTSALRLELTDPGFDSSVLSEFRTRLITNRAEHLLLETLLTLFQGQGLLKVRGRQRTASTPVRAAGRAFNR
jgi:transposase